MNSNNKIGYIYTITNLINNKIYIGQTINAIQRRTSHFSNLRNGKHCNKRLQTDVNIYGIDNFKFEILCECNVDDLNRMEEYYIRYCNSRNPSIGYNIAPVKYFLIKRNNIYIKDFLLWVSRTTLMLFIASVISNPLISALLFLISIFCVVMTAYYLINMIRS